MLPRVSIFVSADTDSAEAGIRRTESGLDRLNDAARRAGSGVNRISRRLINATSTNRNYARAVQNTSFQVADYAVSVAGGIDASIALAQQLPQLLGGFGVLGAVLGAVVAISVPMVGVFRNMSESGTEVGNMLGVLQPAFERIGEVMRSVASAAVVFADVVVNNLDRIIITVGVAAAAFGAKLVGGFITARIATFSLTGALVALRGALIRTGIGALIVAAGEMVFQFTRLVQAAGSFGEAMVLLKDVAIGVIKRIGEAVTRLPDMFKIAGLRMKAFFVSALGSMAHDFVEFTWTVADGLNNLFGTSLMGASGLITQEMNRVVIAAEDAANALSDDVWGDLSGPIEGVEALRNAMSGLNDERVNIADLFGGGEDGEEDGEGGGQSAATKALDEELSAQESRVKEHFDRIKALTMGGLSDKAGAWSDYFGNLSNLTGSSNDKLLKISKVFGAKMALIDAWRAHNAVLADPTLPWWARIASAGSVLAAGFGAVNAIKSSGSGGSGGSSAGATNAQSSTSGASSGGSNLLNVSLTNLAGDGQYSGSEIGSLFDSLGDEARARGLEGIRFV